MKGIINLKVVIILCHFLFILGCNRGNKKKSDTPTSGEITISADESLMPIVDAEVKAFEALYKNAKIKVEYGSEGEAVNKLLNNKARLAILSRLLLPHEVAVLESQKIVPRDSKVGIDAIAFVVHKDNFDTTFTYEQLVGLFSGKITKWKQINRESTLKDIKIIFENDSTASVRYMKDSVAHIAQLPANCYAVNSNPKVLDYVAENKDAIGVIGISWLSDRDDTVSRGFLSKVNVVALSKPGEGGSGEFYQPFQAYIATRDYPITRSMFIVGRETGYGLGTGFMAFVAGDKGQRVILKSGLVPATMPVRIVQFKKNPN